jgi:sugar lactone lactonase YvrE
MSVVACLAPTGDWCGEGILWSPDDDCVYWTDINRFLIHRFNPRDSTVRTWFFDEPVTTVLLTETPGTFLVVLGSGVIFWSPASDSRSEPMFRLSTWPRVRLNDAGIAPDGALWAGTMRNNVNPDGSSREVGGTDGILYRIDGAGRATEHVHNIGVSNTIVWSPDRAHFYFADSLADIIDVYDFGATELENPRPFLHSFAGGKHARGAPDGSAVDSEGFLWNCRYGGSCIVRLAPNGAVDRMVDLPTPNITNCTFGGPRLKTLYITTAAAGTSSGDRFAGGLFALETEVAGQPDYRFRR